MYLTRYEICIFPYSFSIVKYLKESVTMNLFIFFYFLFKSFVKKELSYVFTINMFSTAENCMGSELLY